MTREHALYLRSLIERYLSEMNDEEALDAKELVPTYEKLVEEGKTVTRGFRFRYGDKLYRTEQLSHTFNGIYPPVEGTESLYSEVVLPGDGTIDHPIAYNGNMELYSGKYYTQNDMLYRCIRDTGIPVYNPLADLLGNYVEIVLEVENNILGGLYV